MLATTIPARLQAQGRLRAQHPAYAVKHAGQWRSTTWSEYAGQVMAAARSLVALGFEPGDTVSLLGFNKPQWAVMDHAAMSAGGAGAGIYTTCSPEQVAYIIDHAESRFVLLEDAGQWAKVKQKLAELPRLTKIIMMPGVRVDHELVIGWDEFLAIGKDDSDDTVLARIDALEQDQLAALIYTSGTTGPPKGVMLSHKNLAWTASLAGQIITVNERDSVVSYLPLSHIAEQIFTLHGPPTYGYTVYYAESLEKLPQNFKEVRPTVLFAVPRIWEKFHAGIVAKTKAASPVKLALLGWAQRVGQQVAALEGRGETPSGLLQIQHRLADRLIYSRVKAALGLDRLRFAVSGAAPIATEVLEFFAGLDITILEVYGQSEDTGPTSFNRPGATRFGTVGPPVPGVDVTIADDGEILVKGPNVFLGYYKEPDATAQTLVDGWLHSGDLGRIDEEGFLHITGRKKEIIITAGGKNIAPKNIEAALKGHDLIAEAVVIGDRRKFLSALLWLDQEAAQTWAREQGISASSLASSPLLRKELDRFVGEQVNPRFHNVERIKKFELMWDPLSVDRGELTPTLKVKRRIIDGNYSSKIEGMYAQS